jgi:hypothetical protein
MNDEKKINLITIKVTLPDQNTLVYNLKEELYLGLDPRNDIVVNQKFIAQKHLVFKLKETELVVTQLGPNNTTKLGNQFLIKDKNYILSHNDQLSIGNVSISFDQITMIQNNISNDKNNFLEINELKKFNFNDPKINSRKDKSKNFNLIDYVYEKFDEEIIRNDETKYEIKKIKKNKIKEVSKILPPHLFQLILGFFVDFILSFSIWSTFDNINIHLLIFYLMFELLCFSIFKSPIGYRLLDFKFIRKFGIYFILFISLIIPFSDENLQKIVKTEQIPPVTFFDLHENKLVSKSNLNQLSIESSLPHQFIIFPTLKNHQLGFLFQLNEEQIKIEFENSYSMSDIHKRFFDRNHLFTFQLPNMPREVFLKENLKRELELALASKFYKSIKNLEFNQNPLITRNIKKFFLNDFNEETKLINPGTDSPSLILRDHQHGKIIIWGDKSLFVFNYQRENIPAGPNNVENILIEKVLAKLRSHLVQIPKNDLGILEMFDSLPNFNHQSIIGLFHIEAIKIKILQSEIQDESKKELLKKLFLDQLQTFTDELKRESRNANPQILRQYENSKTLFL